MRLLKFLLPISLLLFALVGCGASNDAEDTDSNGGIVAGEMKTNIEKIELYKYLLTIQNDKTQEEKLTFSSSQDYDYQILDREGENVYTYSADKMFGMAIEEEVVQPGERLEFEIDIREAFSYIEPGDYTLEAWVTANGIDHQKASIPFTYEKAENTEIITYNGQVDLNSIEAINANGEVEVYRLSENIIPEVGSFQEGETLEIQYSVNDVGQKVIEEISQTES